VFTDGPLGAGRWRTATTKCPSALLAEPGCDAEDVVDLFMTLTAMDMNGSRGPVVAWPDGRPLWKQTAQLVMTFEFLRAEWSRMLADDAKRRAARDKAAQKPAAYTRRR
jgi:hypothetical protein